jgi:Holliday junction resolvase RusA-like endonuclease
MIEFFVPGIPKTSGSKKGYPNKKTGGVIIVPANSKDQKQWMSDVKKFAEQPAYFELITGPVKLTLRFYFLRPKSHYGTGRNVGILKKSAPAFHTKTPDLTKLVRCTEDALKGVIWVDDRQVVSQDTFKDYGNPPGVHVIISTPTMEVIQ